MVLFKYLRRKLFPTPSAEVIPSNLTEVANKAVEFVVTHKEIGSEGKAMKRGPYTKFSQRAKITVVKYAAEHGVGAVLHHFNKHFLFRRSALLEPGKMYISLNFSGKGRLVMTAV